MPFTDISTGVRLHYEDDGTGVPVIAVHGRLGTPRIDLGGVIDWLSVDGYHVISPTLRGYGESRPPQRDYPNDFYHRDARDVLAFMDALNVEKAHMIGYSDGGEVALIAAGEQPERFYSVTTIGAVGYFGAAMRPVVQRSIDASFLINDPELMELHGITNPRALMSAWVRAMVHMIDRGGDVSLSLAPKMTCPLLLILGETDTLNPQEYGQRLVDAAPDATLKMFACGHGVHQELFEDFQKTVGAFLKVNSPT